MQAANSESSQVFPHSIITALTSCSHEPEQETPATCLASLEDGLGSLEDGLGSLEDGLGSLEDGLGSLEDSLGSLEDSLGSLEDSLGSLEDGLGGRLRAVAGSVSSLLCWELQTTPIGFMRWHMQS